MSTGGSAPAGPGVPPRSPAARILKDVLDRCGAALGLVGASPVLLAAATAIKLTSRGPVLYRRRVLGRHGVAFDALKLRTMVVDAEAILEGDPGLKARFERNVKLADDPRVTPVGRWLRRASIDELPQLVNVLRGEMSLVGPRMISPAEAPRFGDTLTERGAVKPGLTGLWQVSGRQELDYRRRTELDLEYVRNWSLWLDFVILLRTVPAVLGMRGAL